MSHLRPEGVDLVDAFPDFDGSVYGIAPAQPSRAPKKSRKQRRKDNRQRTQRRQARDARAGMSQLQRAADYYNHLVGIKPPLSDSSDSDTDDGPVLAQHHPPYFSIPHHAASSDSDSSSAGDNPAHGFVNHPSQFVDIPPCQAINDKRSRQAGFVPNPNQPEKQRGVVHEHGVKLPPFQPPRAWRGPTEIHVSNPNNPGEPTLYEHPNPPPLSTSVPYSQLNPHQKARLAVTNQGDTVQHNLASSRQNFMSGGATGGGASSSAAELAFGNLSYANPDSGVDNYERGGGAGTMNPMKPTETADPGMALFDFTQDNLYPHWGYTDYAATYTNPYTGEVTHTYTLDMERYKTDIWKEVPTFELGRPHHKMMAWTGNDRTARPLPRKGEEPNEFVMPSADPTFGYAENVAGRQDQAQRVNRETFFTRDPQLAAPRDEGNWTGYVGLRNMARYDNANVRSLKDAPFAGPPAQPYQIPQSEHHQRPYTQGITAPAFYVSGNPNSFVDTLQYAKATDTVNAPQMPQELDRMPSATADIPMSAVMPQVDHAMMQPVVAGGNQGGARPSHTGWEAQNIPMPSMPTTGVDRRPPQAQGAVNVPMSVLALPPMPQSTAGGGNGQLPQGGDGRVTSIWSGTTMPHATSDAYAPPVHPVDPNPSSQTDYVNRAGLPQGAASTMGLPQGGSGAVHGSFPTPQVGMAVTSSFDAGYVPKALDRPVADMITVNPVVRQTATAQSGWQPQAPPSFNPATLVTNVAAMPSSQVVNQVGHTHQGLDRLPVTDSVMVNHGRMATSDVRGGTNPSAPDRQPAMIQSTNVPALPSAQGMVNAPQDRGALSRLPAAIQATNVPAPPTAQGMGDQRNLSASALNPGDYAQPFVNPGHNAHSGTNVRVASAAALNPGDYAQPFVNPGHNAQGVTNVRVPSADAVRPGDYAQPDTNLMIRPEAMDTIAHLQISVPDSGKMNYELKDGSQYLNSRMNTDAFLQSSWATDTAKARNAEMAVPQNQTITLTNPRVEAAEVMRVKGAEAYAPPQPNRAALAGSRAHAAQVFASTKPEAMCASDTDYETDRC